MKFKLFILLSLFLVAGCSSSYLTIEPGDEYENYEGRKIISKESGEIEYSLNVENFTPEEIDFLVVIENSSMDTVRISPNDLSLKILTSKDEYFSGNEISPLLPLEMLSIIEKERIENESNYATSKSLSCIFGSLNILASLFDENPETDPIYEGGRLLFDLEELEDDYESRENYLNSMEDFWRNDALNTQAVSPGGDAGGIVVFPFNPDIREFVVFVKTKNDVLKYHFEQKEIKE